MTRVAVVADALYPWHKGGKEMRYHKMLARLPRPGVEVTVYSMRWWGAETPPGPVRYEGLCRARPLYINGRRSVRQGLVFALACLKLLARPIDAIESDHMPYLHLFPLWLVAKVKRAPFVVTWNEVWGRDYWIVYGGWFTGRIGALLERWSVKLPDRHVAISATTATRLVELGADPTRVLLIPLGVDADAISEVPAVPDANELVYAGRLLDHKRVDLAIRALAGVRAKGHDVGLSIIGDGDARSALQALAAELGVEAHVHFLGAFENSAEVMAHIKGARVMVFPSEREGFGLVVAEALGGGVPVVCSDHVDNGSRFLVEHGSTGSVVSAGDAEAFTEAIEHWLGDASETDHITAAFLERNRHLDWNEHARGYAALLCEIEHDA